MTPMIKIKADTFNQRDEFVLKYYMNREASRSSQYAGDYFYFMEQFSTSIRNGEMFEQAFITAINSYYNRDLNGLDGYLQLGSNWHPLEAKKETKLGSKKMDGKSMWSIHTEETLIKKANDPNFYLLQFGFRDGNLVYALLIKLVDTDILKNKKPHPTKKMTAYWSDFKNSESVYPLFLNRDLIKKHCNTNFQNFLLSKRECCEEIFGVNLRKLVGLPEDKPEMYYKQGHTITATPKFSATGNTCIAIPYDVWTNQIVPMGRNLSFLEEKSLTIGDDTLYIKRNFSDTVFIRSSIDTTKTKYRELDLTQTI